MFPDTKYQAELEKYHRHMRVDNNFPFHGAHGRLTYDLYDKNWIPRIGKNTLSNCKAESKNKGHQENAFDWKIRLETVHLTRDLKRKTSEDIAFLLRAHK